MKRVYIFLWAMLVVYTLFFLVLALICGSDMVRGFFADIQAGRSFPLPHQSFYGINTTLTVCMLAAIAALYLFLLGFLKLAGIRFEHEMFIWSQVCFFIYIAADERLLLHEWLGRSLHIDDAFVIGAMGLIEVGLLFSLGRVAEMNRRLKGYIGYAALFFGLMVLMDWIFPTTQQENIAAEDLLKTWAVAFLLVFAWSYCMDVLLAARDETAGMANLDNVNANDRSDGRGS